MRIRLNDGGVGDILAFRSQLEREKKSVPSIRKIDIKNRKFSKIMKSDQLFSFHLCEHLGHV